MTQATLRRVVTDSGGHTTVITRDLTIPDPPATQQLRLGMSTEWSRWNERVALTGPVALRRCFTPTWNLTSFMNKVETILGTGCIPYASMKFAGTWAQAAAGADDTRFRDLARALAALNQTVRVTFHHEPRGSGTSTPTQLIPWGQANTRAYQVMRDTADMSQVILGPTDNGFPWSNKAGQNLSDTELAVYYTPTFLAACDALGGDFYDGSTDTRVGEPSHVKMRNFAAWATRRGFTGKLDVGEWNFVDAADVAPTLDVLAADPRWWAASLFNSSENNRTDLPTALGGSWELRPGSDRLAAFRAMLDAADPDR